ncbi:hypothetical protein [Streptomyces sp. NPDC005017]|uniref:hypothetical protein n=1 Tax=Streptomyces sp. NPDC005017 TaxID=3364706 RepID=UPI003685F609
MADTAGHSPPSGVSPEPNPAPRRAGRRHIGPLLWLLDSARAPSQWCDGPLSNTMPAPAGPLFPVLCVKQVRDQPWPEFF